MMSDLHRIARRVLNVFLPGRVTAVDDTGQVQMVQVDHGPQGAAGSLSIRDKTPRLAEFGFFSNPPAGADVAVICVGGDRGNAFVVGTGHQKHRIKNVPVGDAGIHDVRGAYVWLTATGLVIDAAGLNVTIQNCNTLNVTAQHANITSNDVNLGGPGGPAVARVGDTVVGGVITSGSTKVKAA